MRTALASRCLSEGPSRLSALNYPGVRTAFSLGQTSSKSHQGWGNEEPGLGGKLREELESDRRCSFKMDLPGGNGQNGFPGFAQGWRDERSVNCEAVFASNSASSEFTNSDGSEGHSKDPRHWGVALWDRWEADGQRFENIAASLMQLLTKGVIGSDA
jgi:hypothetical protein